MVLALLFSICLIIIEFFCSNPVSAVAADLSQLQAADDDAAVDDGAGFGLTSFVRNNAGTSRSVDGIDLGYRYPASSGSNLIVINTSSTVLVYVDPEAARAVGLNLSDSEQTNALSALIRELDETWSRGGAPLADDSAKTWTFVSEPSYTIENYTYYFRVIAAGNQYVSVVPADCKLDPTNGTTQTLSAPSDIAEAQGITLRDGSLWCDTAILQTASTIERADAPGIAQQLHTFFSGIDYRPFWISLKTSLVAMIFTFVFGLSAAWKTCGTSSRIKGVFDSLFTIPMVLPPTVCGFLLMLLFGQSTAIGRWLIAHGIDIVFTWPAAVISAVVVSFPLMYRTALGAFESLDASMLDAARTLGWSETRIFRTLMMPLAWPSIAAGTVLAFARAMGEFGCTLFFAGNYAGVTQTIPIAIYFDWMGGATAQALFWVVVVIVLSFVVILFINAYAARSQTYRASGFMRSERRALRHAHETPSMSSDTLEPTGGDALTIDRAALYELLHEGRD